MPVFRMRRARRAAALFALLALVLGIGSGPAWAPGSLGLQEVREAVRDAPQLVAEIDEELKNSGIDTGKVICWAGRHGNHWRYLAGRRAAPYECTFGKRVLTIEAQQTYYDPKGRPLGDVNTADPRRAETFRERSFHWTWSP